MVLVLFVVGIGTNAPLNSLHIIPITPNEPLRVEGINPYQLNDSALLIVNPSQGIVRYC